MGICFWAYTTLFDTISKSATQIHPALHMLNNCSFIIAHPNSNITYYRYYMDFWQDVAMARQCFH